MAPKAGAPAWGGLQEARPHGFCSQNTPTNGERRARRERHLGNAWLWDAWLQPDMEEKNVAALCLSFPPVEQDLECLLNFPGQEIRLIGCISRWLGCSAEKKPICCSLKPKWPTWLSLKRTTGWLPAACSGLRSPSWPHRAPTQGKTKQPQSVLS